MLRGYSRIQRFSATKHTWTHFIIKMPSVVEHYGLTGIGFDCSTGLT
jgi:hypothetical protein